MRTLASPSPAKSGRSGTSSVVVALAVPDAELSFSNNNVEPTKHRNKASGPDITAAYASETSAISAQAI